MIGLLVKRFKARFVAGGNLQILGQEIYQVYATVVDDSIVLLILAIGMQLEWVDANVEVDQHF